MNKHLRRFWTALAILPLVAGTALASGPAAFVCRGDSIARRTCCCLESQHRTPAPMSQATLASLCCCDMSRVSVPSIPAVLDPETPAIVAHQQDLAPALAAALATRVSRLAAWRAFPLAPQLPHVVPILLGKQSLLI